MTDEFATNHDRNVWNCLGEILQVGQETFQSAILSASLPLTLGGLGVALSSRIRDAAHWGSWADCLEMVRARHHQVAQNIIDGMTRRASHTLATVEESASRLRKVGVDITSWEALAAGARPQGDVIEWEPTEIIHGWQRHVAVTQHSHHKEQVVWPRLSRPERAMVRSQSGLLLSLPFTAMPMNRLTRMDPGPFRVLLFRRGRAMLSCRSWAYPWEGGSSVNTSWTRLSHARVSSFRKSLW